MRFMMLMIPKGYETAKPGLLPDSRAVEALLDYNANLQQAGVLLEVVGGCWMLEVKSREEALEWARRCPVTQGAVIEVRQVQDLT